MEIISHEAIVLRRYRDSKGIWTIGVGHTKNAGGLNPETFTGRLTVEEAFALFRKDLAKFEARVNRAFTRPLTQHEFDAAVSFDFNTGAINRAAWVRHFNAGNRAAAVKAIMNWTKPKEITERRRKEQTLFATGRYSGGGMATIYEANSKGQVLWGQGKRVNLKTLLGAVPEPKPAPKPTVPVPVAQTGFWAWLVNFFRSILRGGSRA